MLTNFLIEDAYDSLANNVRAALRISLIPFAIAGAAALLINARTLMLATDPTGYQQVTPMTMILVFIGIAFLAFAGFYVAVAWHRFSMHVEGKAGVGRTVRYLLVSLLITFGALLAMIVVLILPGLALGTGVSIVVGSFGEALSLGILHVLLNAIGTLGFAYLFMRFSPWLVSIALGEKSAANFERTKPLSKPIFHTAVIYTVATFLWSLLGLAGLPWPLAVALDLVLTWLAFMMSIAVLTEIYRASTPVQAT